jgi:hypothetical protein
MNRREIDIACVAAAFPLALLLLAVAYMPVRLSWL